MIRAKQRGREGERERERGKNYTYIGDNRTLYGSVGSVTLRYLIERLRAHFFPFGLVDHYPFYLISLLSCLE